MLYGASSGTRAGGAVRPVWCATSQRVGSAHRVLGYRSCPGPVCPNDRHRGRRSGPLGPDRRVGVGSWRCGSCRLPHGSRGKAARHLPAARFQRNDSAGDASPAKARRCCTARSDCRVARRSRVSGSSIAYWRCAADSDQENRFCSGRRRSPWHGQEQARRTPDSIGDGCGCFHGRGRACRAIPRPAR